jgi:hypothetical protein
MTDLSILDPRHGGEVVRPFVTRLLHDELGLGIAIDWAKRLNAMLRQNAVEKLDDVLIAWLPIVSASRPGPRAYLRP